MEPISFSLYNVFVLFGAFQGLLLICIFVFNKNYRKKANYGLITIFVFVFLMGIGNTLEDIEIYKQYPIIKYIPFFHGLLWPVGLYYFIAFLLDATYRFSKKDYWFIIPLALQLTINFGIFFAYLLAPDFMEQYEENRMLYYRFSDFIMLICWLYVIIFTLKRVRQYHLQLFNNYSEIEGKSLFWLNKLTWVFLVFWVFTLISQTHVFLYKELHWIFYVLSFCVTLVIFWLAYFVILRRDIFEIPIFKEINSTESLKPTLSDKTTEHYQKLLQLLQEEKLYQDAQLSMDALAEKTDLSNGYLSKIINQKEGKNFYDFINSYRVEEVKLNLNNPTYAHYSILGIGLEAGFKSKSTFNAVFKKMTGMTPSAYKKNLN